MSLRVERIPRLVVLTIAAGGLALLAGCGFQLRGGDAAPAWPARFQRIAIADSAGQEDIAALLRYRLIDRYGVEVVEAGDVPVVRIRMTDLGRRVLVVDSFGKASAYLLRYRVDFAVDDARGAALVPAQSIQVQRDFSFSASSVLAKEAEERRLRAAMTQDALDQVVRRLAAADTGQP
jgi:LPS-assembly lipoprotein